MTKKKQATINRLTKDGLVECKGKLFEYKGYQYVLTRDKEDWFAIEVTTGASIVYFHNTQDLLYADEARMKLREQIKMSHRLHNVEDALMKFINVIEEYELEYPINKPICHD